MIAPIEQIRSIATAEVPEKADAAGSMFGSVFQAAIENVRQTDLEKTRAQYLLATGQLDNPAAAMMAATKNQISVELLVQLRNKALDAYSELTRMNL